MCHHVPVNPIILSRGSQGEAVKHLQKFLSKIGHYLGTINGYFCDATEQSVRAFQTQIGLPADGIVNQRTWKAMNRLENFLGY